MAEEVLLTERSEKTKSLKFMALFFGIILVYTSITDFQVGKLIVGLVFVFYSGYRKTMVVKKDGIDYTYSYFGYKRYDKIVFAELDEVVVIRHGKNHLAYFVKGQTSVRLSLEPEKLAEMVDFISKHSQVSIREENLGL